MLSIFIIELNRNLGLLLTDKQRSRVYGTQLDQRGGFNSFQ